MIPYHELAGLEQVYLEDSFVLGVEVLPGIVKIQLDVVLREGHPDYAAPGAGEEYCFRRGILSLEEASEVSWRMPEGRPAVDASGETDYGGIDSYEVDGSTHRIVGEIGVLSVTCRTHLLNLDEGSWVHAARGG